MSELHQAAGISPMHRHTPDQAGPYPSHGAIPVTAQRQRVARAASWILRDLGVAVIASRRFVRPSNHWQLAR
jgi:hypothetical protein